MESYVTARRQAAERARLAQDPNAAPRTPAISGFEDRREEEQRRLAQQQFAEQEAARQQQYAQREAERVAYNDMIARARQADFDRQRQAQEERIRAIQEQQANAGRMREEMFANMYGQEVHYKMCMRCKKEVSDDARPGQRCPHCGCYWRAYIDENGNKEYASGSSDDSQEGSGGSLAGGIGLLAAVVGLIAAGMRWFLS